MSLKNLIRFRHTLAFRLTLWYAGVFTLTCGLAFLFFYLLITTVIQDGTDRDLKDQAGRFSTLLSMQGLEAVKRVAILEAQAAGERKIFFRLLSVDGAVFSSSNMSYWRDIGVENKAIRELVRVQEPVFDTIVISERKDKVRILYGLIGPGVILQLGQSMENQTRFIEAFRKIFIATMTFLVLLAALIGWFMARQALSGLGEVTRTAKEISGGTLEKRVPVNRRGDEIAQLAITFNEMLERIEGLVVGIKEMSDNIAHDLKSPITRIRGISEVTLTTETSLDEYKSMAASTIEECDRLLDMINTMLIISRTEAGLKDSQGRELDLGAVLQDAATLFHPLAEDKEITMAWDIAGRFPIRGDNRMIQRMIANLLDNAIKYTPPGGKIEVVIHNDGAESSIVTIKDSGIGISEKDLPHIFERFYRCDPSRAESGIGLGLSLARAIAQAHGGDIDVISSLGNGSTFRITLPKSSDTPQ
jgi:heavy metal sensor kinase